MERPDFMDKSPEELSEEELQQGIQYIHESVHGDQSDGGASA